MATVRDMIRKKGGEVLYDCARGDGLGGLEDDGQA